MLSFGDHHLSDKNLEPETAGVEFASPMEERHESWSKKVVSPLKSRSNWRHTGYPETTNAPDNNKRG